VDASANPSKGEPAYGNAEYGGTVTCKYAGVPDGEVRPVSRTWATHEVRSDDELIRQFEQDGFCILASAIPVQELAALRGEALRLAADWASLGERAGGFDLEPRQPGFVISATGDDHPSPEDIARLKQLPRPSFRKMDCYPLSEPHRRLAAHPRIVGIMRRLVGSRGYLFYRPTFPKVAGLAREKVWHHDAAYWATDWQPTESVVQSMTVIDPHGSGNGGLLVIPGSHREEWSHEFKSGERKARLRTEDLERAWSLDLSPGNVLVFHSKLLHASTTNTSSNDRMVVYNAYCGRKLEYIGSGNRPALPEIWC
jgi:hypothetical protein